MLKTTIFSPQLGQTVRLEIAFPPGFPRLRPPFPAVLLNDAQNQWTNRGSYGGWHTDSITADLFRKGRLPPLVLIGLVSPGDRDKIFGPPPYGKVDKFSDFLADTLLPALRKRIPISKNSADIAIVGASYGANASLYVGLHRPDAIGLVAAMSGAPHFGKPLGALLAEHRRLPMRRLYIDCGTKWAYDQPHMDDSTNFNKNIISIARQRLPRNRFLGVVAQGHFHNEEHWRKRVGRALQFLFNAKT